MSRDAHAQETQPKPQSAPAPLPLEEIVQTEPADPVDVYVDADEWAPEEQVLSTPHPLRNVHALVHPDGSLHLVWTSNNWLWFTRQVKGGWDEPQRVFVGTQPSAVIDAKGTLHVVFAHSFAGRYQIYYTRFVDPYWAFPYEISRTPGISHNPHLAVSRDGLLYAVWEDDTPGFPSIYHAYNPQGYWINAPVPGARGWRPVIAFDGEDRLHMVWESPIPTGSGDDIFHSQMSPGGWTLPENISDSPKTDSSIPRIAGDKNGRIHVVWQEQWANRSEVGYASGRYASWSRPIALTRTGRNYAPDIVVDIHGAIHVLWQDLNVLAYRYYPPGEEGGWYFPEALDRHISGAEETAITTDSRGRIHVFWTRKAEEGWAFYHRWRENPLKHTQHIPLVPVGAS